MEKSISRKFNWVSSLESTHQRDLESLQTKMINYYTNNDKYYSDIDFTANYWMDDEQLLYQDILKEMRNAKKILEIGCGSANVLKVKKIDYPSYTGIEFSQVKIDMNKKMYPGATFIRTNDPNKFPINHQTFDLVYSIFVIEHNVFPYKFLEECKRVLKPNGMLIILAPDFLGNYIISSQRVGLKQGTGREKLQKGRILDAILTGFDSKIRMPFKMSSLRKLADKRPRFYINLTPTCFEDPFITDSDAVYITYEKEIRKYLEKDFIWTPLEDKLINFAKINKMIYLKGLKS